MDKEQILDAMTGLVEKSLIICEEGAEGQTRYRLPESVRHYGVLRLTDEAEARALRERHIRYFAHQSQTDVGTLMGLTRMEAEHDNFRAALDWLLEDPNASDASLRFATALQSFWEMRGYFSEGRTRLNNALAKAGADADPSAHLAALNAAGSLAWHQSDFDAAQTCFVQALHLARTIPDDSATAGILIWLGNVAYHRADLDGAQKLYEESSALARACAAGVYEYYSTLWLGNVAARRKDWDTACARYEECLKLTDDWHSRAYVLDNLGRVYFHKDDWMRAAQLHRQSLRLRRDHGDRVRTLTTLEHIGQTALAQGHPHQAARLFSAAQSLRDTLSLPLPPINHAEHDRSLDALRDALPSVLFTTLWSEGQTWTWEQAVIAALREEEPSEKAG